VNWGPYGLYASEIKHTFIPFSYKPRFPLSGYLNVQNDRQWFAENPTLSLVRDVLYVQLAILSPCLETLNLHQYIRQALIQRFEHLSDYNRTYAILQQDSVSPGTAINLVLWLQRSFSNGIISKELWTHITP